MNTIDLLRETFSMARGALVANRMRSLLALLGVVIGVATVIGMVSLINGFQRSFQQSIQSLGNLACQIWCSMPIRAILAAPRFGADKDRECLGVDGNRLNPPGPS